MARRELEHAHGDPRLHRIQRGQVGIGQLRLQFLECVLANQPAQALALWQLAVGLVLGLPGGRQIDFVDQHL